jgi:hypothetical protein
MRSFTSAFERLNVWLTPGRALMALLCAVGLYMGALEIAASLALNRISTIGIREERDHRVAAGLRPRTADGRQTVLIVGNSLLQEGIDRGRLNGGVAGEIMVSVFPILSTAYLDWYFGLRRLLGEGARPFGVVVCLSPPQLVSGSINGDAFARRMMRLRDIGEVARAADLDLTSASGLFFASLSDWLAARHGIRNWLLGQWLPQADMLARALARRTAPAIEPGSPEMSAKMQERLLALKNLAQEHGVRFAFLVPALASAEGWDELRMAAGRAGVVLAVPHVPGELAPGVFADGFHLNGAGAAVFTDRLARTLPAVLAAAGTGAGTATGGRGSKAR